MTREQRIAEIRKQGFKMFPNRGEDVGYYRESYAPVDFSKIRVGAKVLKDATINFNPFIRYNPSLGDKDSVMRAINQCDYEKMRQISNFFYRTSGIYQRLCKYLAYMYRYDWYITPYIHGGMSVVQTDGETLKETEIKKISDNFFQLLRIFDDFGCKKFFGEVALKVIRNGCFYGYLVGDKGKVKVQELPPKYCRSRFSVNGRPAVEFNMAYFNDIFTDTEQRIRVLNLFPKEFLKGYRLYQQGKLKPDFQGDTSGWYLLDTRCAIKFNCNGEDFPPLIAVIPAIIDLESAQELDRRRMAQKLLKIIIQKLPLDKNGDPTLSVEESEDIHNNAVAMLTKAIGVDVLTTFAEVQVADMADRNTTTTTDELQKVERAVFNAAGVSQLQFNSEGNIALTNSILNDEASIYNLLLQFEDFMNMLLEPFNKQPKKFYFKAQILSTTIYNYKDLAKLYKEQTQLGYSKILAQLALGQSQSSILANASFENDVLDLVNVFIPPMSSNTMNAQVLADRNSKQPNNSENVAGQGAGAIPSDNKGGRPEKEDVQKAEKTIMNKESQS